MKDVKVKVDIRFMDCRHHTVCHAVLASDGLYDFDQYMYEAINSLGLSPDSGDKFEVISYKVYNLCFVHPENLPPLDPRS